MALRQYHTLLALRELPEEHRRRAIRVLKKASDQGLSPEVRALASELLTTLGIKVKADRDKKTGLDQVWFNPIDETELVLIPEGSFKAGSKEFKDNRPRDLELPSFYLARYLVTNAQYKKYLDANLGAKKPAYWDEERFSQPEQPVVGVSAMEADAYCKWAGLRLPTEWEWEKGARGTDGQPYPWGEKKPTRKLANFDMNVGHPTAVGSYPKGASPYGLMDTAGNVWEWTSSIYKEGEPWRTLRGGSFGIGVAVDLLAAFRGVGRPDGRGRGLGFRCARDP